MNGICVRIFSCIFLISLLLANTALGAEKGEISFCTTFNDAWEAQGTAGSFASNVISWIAKSKEEYGTQQLTLSIYKVEGAEEKLVERRKIDVRPTWNTSGMRNLVLPGIGRYSLSLEKQDGATLSEGKVSVTKMHDSTTPAAKTETIGASLSDLFNKYLPKK